MGPPPGSPSAVKAGLHRPDPLHIPLSLPPCHLCRRCQVERWPTAWQLPPSPFHPWGRLEEEHLAQQVHAREWDMARGLDLGAERRGIEAERGCLEMERQALQEERRGMAAAAALEAQEACVPC
jgi:hypothetical protein